MLLAQSAHKYSACSIFGVGSVHRGGLLRTAHAVKSPARNTSSPPQDAFQWKVAEGDTRRWLLNVPYRHSSGLVRLGVAITSV